MFLNTKALLLGEHALFMKLKRTVASLDQVNTARLSTFPSFITSLCNGRKCKALWSDDPARASVRAKCTNSTCQNNIRVSHTSNTPKLLMK